MGNHRTCPHGLGFLFYFAMTILLAACNAGTDPEWSDIAFQPLAGNLYGDWPVRTYEIRTEQEWQQAWDAHNPMIDPPPPRPQVDFSTSMLLGISAGWGANGCYSLVTTRITDEPVRIRVEYRLIQPSPTVVCTQALVPLVSFSVIPRNPKPAYFVQIDA